MTDLGGQLPNPYNIDTMKHASRIVKGSDSRIVTNHLYIKFSPANYDELSILDLDSNLILSDIPLDREINVEGTYYHDPSINDEEITPYYAVVTPNQILPNVQYTILDELYIPDEDTEDDIEMKALDLCGIPYPTTSSKGLFLDRKKPNGRITVDIEGGTRGLDGAKVIAFNWFRHKKTFSDANGNFSFDKKFWRARIKVKFKSHKGRMHIARGINIYRMIKTYTVKIKNNDNSSYVFKGDDLQGISFNFDNNTDISTKAAENWYCATVWNGLYDFHNIANQTGLPRPAWDQNIFITSYTADGAASMLHQMGKSGYNVGNLTYKLQELANLYVMSFAIIDPAGQNYLVNALQRSLPDIVIGMDAGNDSRDVTTMTFHELGHSIHYEKAGNYYWEQEIDYTIDNSGYGDGTANDAGRCALVESWGYFIEDYFEYLKYGNGSDALLLALENRIGENGYEWFPVGVYLDLWDNEGFYGGPDYENTLIEDNFGGMSIADTYNMLTSNVNSPDKLRDAIISNYPGSQSDIETLFNGYGY